MAVRRRSRGRRKLKGEIQQKERRVERFVPVLVRDDRGSKEDVPSSAKIASFRDNASDGGVDGASKRAESFSTSEGDRGTRARRSKGTFRWSNPALLIARNASVQASG